MGGGGARGFAHVAVLELLEEMGIPIDMIAGVSSGAIVGALYSIGYSPAEILDAFDSRDWPSFFSDRPRSPFVTGRDQLPLAFTLGRGYSTGQRAYTLLKSLTAKIPSYIDFDTLPIPFRAAAVEVPQGNYVLIGEGSLAEAVRASMGIQGVFEPFVINGRSFVDAGLLNNLPVREVRELGFDIIIAVELFAPPLDFSTTPLGLIDLMTIINSRELSAKGRELADVVLLPLPADAPMMDFSIGREIYAMAIENKEEMRALLEPIREIIAAAATRESPRQRYKDLPPIIPQRLIIKGALTRDRPFIERQFSRLIRGRPLTEENITAFLDTIFETGNYNRVLARPYFGSLVYLEVRLYPEAETGLLFRAGFDYMGTFSSQSFSRTALRSGIEFKGSEGFSMLLRASFFDELSLGLSVSQAVNPYFFLAAEADIVRDQVLIVNGILSRETITPQRLFYFRGAARGDLRFNRHNSLSIQPEYFWFRDEDNSYTIAGFGAAYTFSTLNHSLFPTRGFRAQIDNRFRIVPDDPNPFNILGVDLTGRFPLNRQFSFGVCGFGSALFGEPDLPPEISLFFPANTRAGNAARYFFPHAFGIFAGEKKAAFSMTVQYEPWENLTILGGRLIFFLTASAGNAGSFEWQDWFTFGRENLIWNVSFGTALLAARNFGLQLRGGAGGGNGLRPAPFVSLDIGMSAFQKGLF